jgi:diguanylate cyclase (GGDEF)-like protein/PAS domain S-box-containing protein
MLHLLRRGRRRTRSDLDGLIDMAVVAIVAVLVLWEFWLQPSLSDASVPLFVRTVWAAYPVLDAILLAVVVRALIELRTCSTMAILLAGGVICWLIADFSFMIFAPSGSGGLLLDVGWMVGAALLAAGCWSVPNIQSTDDTHAVRDQQQIGPARIALAIAPLLVPGFIDLVSSIQGHDPHPVPLLAATMAFVMLAGARALRLVHLRDQAQQGLASSERLYRALAANSSDAVILLDADGIVMNDAPNLATLLGYPGGQTKGYRAFDFLSGADVDSRTLFDQTLLAPGVVLSGEARTTRTDGRELWLSTRVVNLLREPDVGGIVVNLHDITDRKQVEEELVHQAFHDSLTGLANRALFRDRVEHALTRRSRTGFDPAVMYFGLDGFKNVNDGLGHDAGDCLLREVATRLSDVVRSGDTIARLGADEFAVLVEESSHGVVEAESIAERMLESLKLPVTLGGHDVTLSASIGIAHADAESTATSLLRDADVAMYQAKTTGKARWVLYEPTMRAAAVQRVQLENELTYALERDQFKLVYQPVVDLETNRIVGFEALLRWEHPELGAVMPDQFIPIAEDNGTIIPIGRWVLQTACRTAAAWRDKHPGHLTMAVNLSARQLASADLFHHVQDALRAARLDPSALVLEMTETALVQDATLAAARLHQLRTLGVRLAIDDFGTGYSSLSYLRQFPVDILKIDRSFINTITDRERIPAIVRGLLDLARTLELETIAEGIETDAQLGQLRDQHCGLGQGYLFARPLPLERAEALLDRVPTPL